MTLRCRIFGHRPYMAGGTSTHCHFYCQRKGCMWFMKGAAIVSEVVIYESLLRRSFERGVPDDAIAEIFELPLDIVKEMAKETKVARFGTDDKNKYLDNLEWETLERVTQLVRTGSADQVTRISTAILGKQIAAAGKRPSSATEESRQFLLDAFAGIRESPNAQATPGRFVMGRVDVDRKANREDEDDE